jgi:hypothetical protein
MGPNLVGVDMPDNSSLINQFRKSKTMSAFTQGATVPIRYARHVGATSNTD